MKQKLIHFMNGRYGVDSLNRFLLGLALVLILLSMFVRVSVFGVSLLNLLGLAALIYAYFRMLSRNVQKRYREYVRFMAVRNKITGFFKNKIWYLKQSRQYHIYKCPGCGQKIRIPRGKGRIEISCPKCRHKFIKKS